MTRSELIAALDAAGAEDAASEASILLDGLFGISATAALIDRSRDYDTAILNAGHLLPWIFWTRPSG